MRVVESLLQLVSVSAPLALAVTLVTLALLSKRLGDVTQMPAYYRWLYVAASLAGIAAFFQLLYALSIAACSGDTDDLLCNEAFYVLTYAVPLALGLTISVVVAWRYWGWLIREPSD